jgi:hypothetical protein
MFECRFWIVLLLFGGMSKTPEKRGDTSKTEGVKGSEVEWARPAVKGGSMQAQRGRGIATTLGFLLAAYTALDDKHVRLVEANLGAHWSGGHVVLRCRCMCTP